MNDTHVVWLDPLTRAVKNPINIFFINPNIILYHVLFIKHLLSIRVSIGLESTEKKFGISFYPVFYILSFVKYLEILHKQCVIFYFSVFCFELMHFYSINKWETVASITE